ncbi:serine/threonine-protein kinase [Kangiella sediminilitoris]|uniref:Serine/threonine protein kinase with TPR repeats n=1 Tax=Kangiella sediminilitoris TaxID=1144748 RepID=A0A1B3BAI9_9GAMM|nr:serine/threonine-protein kinase [Kangiella sediminilitoris]AOE49822.1 Serine/threonine protein kinase with TPR repeats [Kangiella sediminilitoris]
MGHNDLDPKTKSNSLKETQVLRELHTLNPGTLLIGRFEILSKQGCGRYGCVYKAKDRQLDSFVAIKVLHQHLLNEQAIQSFKNEILILRQLSHQNIVRVHEYYQDEETHFITMDWIDGKSLTDLINSQSTGFPVKKALGYMQQVLDALLVTEQKGISHCDLKPENILVDNEERVYVADFGVASALSDTEEESIHGTPVYASPEYLELGQINKTTDTYSVGVILYELITGHTPFSSSTINDLLQEKKRETFNGLPKKAAGSELSSLVSSCLAAEPKRRPQSLASLSERIAQLVNETPKRNRISYGYLSLAAIFSVVIIGSFYLLQKEDTRLSVSAEQKQMAKQGLAILPFKTEAMSNQLWLTQGLPSVLSQELSQAPDLRVVGTARTKRTMDLLGYSRDLSDQKFVTLSELLQTPVFLDTSIILIGPNKYRLKAEVVEVTGNNISRTQLLELQSSEQEFSKELKQLTESLNTFFSLSNITDQLLMPEGLSIQKWSELEVLIKDGKLARAKKQLESLINNYPEFAQAHFLLGEVLLKSGEEQEAGEAFKKVKELTAPNQLIHQKSTIEQFLIAGDLESASTVYETILERLPKRDDIRFELAQLYINLEQLDKAEIELKHIVEEDQNHPVAWYELSKVAIWKGQTEKAVDDYLVKALVTAKKLKNEQLRGDVLNAFGVAYHRLGELDLSLDYYQQGLEVRQSVGDSRGIVTSLSNLASIYAVKGQYDKAEQNLYQAIEVNKPRNDALKQADLFNELGVIAEEQGQYKKALEHFRASLSIRMKLDDDWLKAESLNNVAYIYFLLSDEEHATIYWEQAKNYYEKVKDPVGVVRVNENVGQLSLRKGDWQSAFQIFSQAKEKSESLSLFEERVVAEAYLAKLALLKGNFEAPLEKLKEIKATLSERDDIRGQIEFGIWLADWNIISGNYSEASRLLQLLEPLLSKEHNRSQQMIFHVLKSKLKLYQGESVSLDESDLPDADGLTSKASLKLLLFKLEKALFTSDVSKAEFNDLVAAIESYDLALHQFALLEYLQLKAIYYIKINDYKKLEVSVNQLRELRKSLGSHWSDFISERIISNYYQLTSDDVKAQEYGQLAVSKFKELLEELPEEQQKNLISLHGRYIFPDDFMEKLL